MLVLADHGVFVATSTSSTLKSEVYYHRNHKRASINVQRSQVSPSLHPMESTYERLVLCTHVVFSSVS